MTEAAVRLVMASVALSTTVGVFVHDSHLDAATITALSIREKSEKDPSSSKLSPDLHTHSEHTKMKKANRHSSPDPRDHLKHRYKKPAPKVIKSGNTASFQFA